MECLVAADFTVHVDPDHKLAALQRRGLSIVVTAEDAEALIRIHARDPGQAMILAGQLWSTTLAILTADSPPAGARAAH